MEHPTLLRRPELDLIGRPGLIAEDVLPLSPEAYQVANDGAWWTVREVATSAIVYSGPGPVEVVRSGGRRDCSLEGGKTRRTRHGHAEN
jgi:hypothetical protein